MTLEEARRISRAMRIPQTPEEAEAQQAELERILPVLREHGYIEEPDVD